MTADQMKAALAAALAFLVAACAVLALILASDKHSTEQLLVNRLSLAQSNIVQCANKSGWANIEATLQQQAKWSPFERPHVWLLEKSSNNLIDAVAAFPVATALRALSSPTKSIAIEETSGSGRLHMVEAELENNRLLIGIVTPVAGHSTAQVVYAVLLSGIAGILSAIAVVYWASRRSNRRISDTRHTLSEFLAGDSAKRVVFPGPVDSLYELAHSVNRVLNQSETQAQNLNYLSADIAHNLKRPLTRLRNRLEAARDAEDIAPRYRAHADRAVRDLDGIIKIFEAQLNISLFQAGCGRSRFQDVDLRALVAHIIATYQSIIEDSGKTLQVHLPDKVPCVRGTPGLITEMIVNIIENAVQHCPPGTAISICILSSNDEVSIIIADNGPGVPAEDVEAVLQRFKRLDTSRPGHGIGMPFAVAVAELHDAMLELANNNPGLKVTVSFPIDFSSLTPQLGLRMRSGLKLKLQSDGSKASNSNQQTLQNL